MDETLEYHPSSRNAQRMSFEAFTFVGAEQSVAYLQCDVIVCDAHDEQSRCKADCLPAARRRRAPLIISSKSTEAGTVESGPIWVTNKRLARPRREVQLANPAVSRTELSTKVLNKSGRHLLQY